MRRRCRYRRLGRSGLKVSVLSFGSWVSFGDQLDTGVASECLAAARDGGRELLRQRRGLRRRRVRADHGRRHRRARLGPRETYVVSHEVLLGHPRRRRTCATRSTASTCCRPSTARSSASGSTSSTSSSATGPTRTRRSRRRSGRCPTSSSRARPTTGAPRSGRADEIRAAWEIAERHHLHKPVMEQPQYNLFERRRVEQEYARLYEDIGLGLTTWSPLAVGPAHRQVPRRHPGGQPGRAARLRVARRHAHRRGPQRRRCGRCRRSPSGSASRWRSSPSPGAPRTRTSRR